MPGDDRGRHTQRPAGVGQSSVKETAGGGTVDRDVGSRYGDLGIMRAADVPTGPAFGQRLSAC